jgi:hypothetical protein
LKESKILDVKALLKQAQGSEHGETYKTLDRNPNFRIGIGVRLTAPNTTSFFVEIIIYLCPSSSKIDLKVLEKSLACLKELQARNYSLISQDDNCISCEITTPAQKLAEEYAAVESLLKTIFS